jgi:hypothetical protein
MTTVSYPAVGNGGLNDAQWSILYGGEDGIYNDFTANGNAFELQLISASNIARILAPTVPTGATAPVIKVNGYGLQVTANEDFTVPNPATTTTYSLYAQYDPALNVADGSGNANPLGPVRLLFSAGDPDTSGGKQSFVLYTIRRQPGQALSAITPSDYRQWVGPHRSGNSLIYEQAEGAGRRILAARCSPTLGASRTRVNPSAASCGGFPSRTTKAPQPSPWRLACQRRTPHPATRRPSGTTSYACRARSNAPQAGRLCPRPQRLT